jgi:hypothetical protein
MTREAGEELIRISVSVMPGDCGRELAVRDAGRKRSRFRTAEALNEKPQRHGGLSEKKVFQKGKIWHNKHKHLCIKINGTAQ